MHSPHFQQELHLQMDSNGGFFSVAMLQTTQNRTTQNLQRRNMHNQQTANKMNIFPQSLSRHQNIWGNFYCKSFLIPNPSSPRNVSSLALDAPRSNRWRWPCYWPNTPSADNLVQRFGRCRLLKVRNGYDWGLFENCQMSTVLMGFHLQVCKRYLVFSGNFMKFHSALALDWY